MPCKVPVEHFFIKCTNLEILVITIDKVDTLRPSTIHTPSPICAKRAKFSSAIYGFNSELILRQYDANENNKRHLIHLINVIYLSQTFTP
jgi:hypothetical protein